GAARDLARSAALGERELATASLYLALPPKERPGTDPRLAAIVGKRIGAELEIRGLEARTRVFPSGHAGAVAALSEAVKDVRARRVSRAVVGGVDTLVEPDTVAHYHAKGRLKHG